MTTMLTTYVNPVLAMFTATFVDLINKIKGRAKDTTNTVVVTVTDTPIQGSHINTISPELVITRDPITKIFDAFEISPENMMTPRAFIQHLQQRGMITDTALLNVVRAMGENASVMTTAGDIPSKLVEWIGATEAYDKTIISFLNIVNGGSITALGASTKFMHVAVVNNDDIDIRKNGLLVGFKNNVVTDVVTYIVFDGGKFALPVYTQEYGVNTSEMNWVQITFGTKQYDAIVSAFEQGTINLEVFGFNRAIFSIINQTYFGLLVLRQKIATTGASTVKIDNLIAEYEATQIKATNVLTGNADIVDTVDYTTLDGINTDVPTKS